MAKKTKSKTPEVDEIQSLKIPIDLVDNNTGQIPGVKENPREMTEMEYKKLKRSLTKHPGFTAINEMKVFPFQGRWVTIGGNMRLQAMKELGWTHIIGKPIPADTDADTLNYYILLDNANFGKWDFDKLANQWSEDILNEVCIELPPMDEPQDEDEAKDDDYDVEGNLPAKPQSRLGDIYQLGDHRLIVGDSTKAEYLDALMDGEAVDCLITDPPYNVDYNGHMKHLEKSGRGSETARKGMTIANDCMAEPAFVQFLTDALGNASEHMKGGAAYYVWHSDVHGLSFRTAITNVGWQLRQNLIWVKSSLCIGRQDYQWMHEPCLYGWKDGASHYFTTRRDQPTIYDWRPDIDAMSKDDLKKALRDILFGEIPTTVIDEAKPLRNADHPTMKPVPLIGRQVRNSTRPGQTVLDIFGGSGTTMIACEQLGRKCRMVEFDPVYADVIIKRWEEFTHNQAKYMGNILDNPKKDITDNNQD